MVISHSRKQDGMQKSTVMEQIMVENQTWLPL